MLSRKQLEDAANCEVLRAKPAVWTAYVMKQFLRHQCVSANRPITDGRTGIQSRAEQARTALKARRRCGV